MNEKDYGLEYEKEVLAAFDRMKSKYDSPEGEAKQEAAAPAAASVSDETRVFAKPVDLQEDPLVKMADDAASFEQFIEAELGKPAAQTDDILELLEQDTVLAEPAIPEAAAPAAEAVSFAAPPQPAPQPAAKKGVCTGKW